MARSDTLDLVELAYRLDLDEQAWLAEIAAAAHAQLDRGLGVSVYTLETRGRRAGQVGAMVSHGADPGMVAFATSKLGSMPPPIAETVLRVPLGFAASSEIAGADAIRAFLGDNPYGMVDTCGVQSLDPSGSSLWIVVPATEVITVQDAMRERWQRVAAHLTAALRLRRGLASLDAKHDDLGGADAVLETDFSVAHATARATPELEALRAFAKQVDRARGRLRRDAPDDALELWKGLCEGTWSFIDHVDSDGRRYLVARHNEPAVATDRALTAREQQVVAFVAMGHADKLVAYELGLAESTVQSHLSSAMRKMGIASRSELVRTVLALSSQGEG